MNKKELKEFLNKKENWEMFEKTIKRRKTWITKS